MTPLHRRRPRQQIPRPRSPRPANSSRKTAVAGPLGLRLDVIAFHHQSHYRERRAGAVVVGGASCVVSADFRARLPSPRLYSRWLMVRLLAVALGSLGYAIYDPSFTESVQVSVPLFCAGLFLCCLFCHGELAHRRPAPRYLTSFYLMISLGGALGAIFVGILAPYFFTGVYEFPLTLCLTALLAVIVVWPEGWLVRVFWGIRDLMHGCRAGLQRSCLQKRLHLRGSQFLRWPSCGVASRLAQAALPHSVSWQDRARRAVPGPAEEPSGHHLLRPRIPGWAWHWTTSPERRNALAS